MLQDLFDDARVFDETEYTSTAAALGASQGIDKIDYTNEARPGASAETAKVVVLRDVGARSRHRSEGRPRLDAAVGRGPCCYSIRSIGRAGVLFPR